MQFWLEEALRQKLERKLDVMEASLLPNQKSEVIKKAIDRVKNPLFEMEYADEIEDTVKFNKERTEFYAQEAKKRRLERKAKKQAKRNKKK